MDSPPFQFITEQQRRIYQDLQLFGDGPAAFFKDACRLVMESNQYESTTHLVAHLLREVIGAIRDVMQPPEVAPQDSTWVLADLQFDGIFCYLFIANAKARSTPLEDVLRFLGFSEIDFEWTCWKRLASAPDVNLAMLAHRHHLGIRAKDQLFDHFWSEVQDFLERLLDKAKDRLLDITRPIELLAEKVTPTDSDIQTIRNRLPHHPLYLRRFFSKLRSAGWLASLQQAGYFRAPPNRLERDGSMRLQEWPQSAYLARISRIVPEQVRDVILSVPFSNNDAIISDFAEAALAMPPAVARPVVERIIEWINDHKFLFLVEHVAKNISHLAKGDQEDTAFALASALLHVELTTDASLSGLDRQPTIRLERFMYGEVLREQIGVLHERHPQRTVRMLCDLLEGALPPLTDAPGLGGEWEVLHYRESIANTPEYSDLMFANALIDGIRDVVGRSHWSKADVSQFCAIFDGYTREVFRRLKLYALTQAADPTQSIIVETLLSPADFDNSRIWPELKDLLKIRFGSLKSTEKNSILSWIARGPQGQWPEANDPDRERKVRYWKFKKLQPIGASLSGPWKTAFASLSSEFDEGDREEQRQRELSDGWEVSPVDKGDFAKQQVEEIVSYVLNWIPSRGGHPRASRDSLLRTLEEAVGDEPARFADNIDVLAQLDAHARSHIVSGLSKALAKSRPFDWRNVLRLCHTSLDLQPMSSDSDALEHIRWLRQVIAQLVLAGLESDGHVIPMEHRDVVLRIILNLARDIDPMNDREEGLDGSIGGAWGLAINSVRGYAIQALFAYSEWCSDSKANQTQLEAEVWQFIDSYVAMPSSWNRTSHVVLGSKLPMLQRADEQRAIQLLPGLLPIGDHHVHLFDAAWEGFIMHWNPASRFLQNLRGAYGRAVERLVDVTESRLSGTWSPTSRLGIHLVTYYGWGNLDFGSSDGLLEGYFQRAPVAVRADILQWIGRLKWKDDVNVEERQQVIGRYQRLLEQRITFFERLGRVEEATELEAIGNWVISPYFDQDWSLKQLQRALKIVGRIRHDSNVLQHFETLVRSKPREVLACVELMVEKGKDEWGPARWHRYLRKVFEGASDSADQTVVEAMRRLINRMSTRGVGGFDDLLDQPVVARAHSV
jgi:hypothetical protein